MVNNFVGVGRISYTNKSDKFSSFNLAIQDRTGETDFVPVSVFGKTKDFFDKYFDTGKWIGVTGRVSARKIDDKYRCNVIAERLSFVGNKPQEGSDVDDWEKLSDEEESLLPF